MNTRIIPIVLVAAVGAAAACGAPGADQPRRSATYSSPAPAAPRSLTACFVPLPATWAGTQRGTLPTMLFLVGAVAPAGDRAFGLYVTGSLAAPSEQGMAAVDLATGTLHRLVTFPGGSAGIAGMAAEPPWIAWLQAASSANPGAITLYARNLDTGEQLTLATPPPNGLGAPGSVAIHQGMAAWTQGSTAPGQAPTAEVHLYDLAAHQQTVLDAGKVGAPVFAGRYLVWTHGGDDGSKVLQAVDASTRQPVQLPSKVRGSTLGSITDLAGSPDTLVWTTDERHAVAWRMDRDQLTTYTVDLRNRLQFLTLAGHFLIWYTGSPTAVMDLDTGGGYDLNGEAAGSAAAIVLTTPARAAASKIDNPGTVVSVLATAGAPAIPACRA